MNYTVNLRNLLQFSKPFADTIADSMLHFSDTSGMANSTVFGTTNVTAHSDSNNGVAAYQVDRGDDYNAGFDSRQKFLEEGKTKDLILSLNRCGVFESFRDQIFPPGKVNIAMEFEKDDEVIFLKLMILMTRITFIEVSSNAINFMPSGE